MKEFQSIIDITLPFVKSLLIEYGEFYPLASALNINWEVEQVLLEEDEVNNFPKSTSVIGKLKKELRWKQNKFLAIALFYDVNLKDHQTDAIAVFIEHKKEKQAFTLYYPYQIIDKIPVFSESWKVIEKLEIFGN